MFKFLFAKYFRKELYQRYNSIQKLKEYYHCIKKGEISKDDILAYLHYFQSGSWDDLIERFGEIKVKQYEAIGYLKHHNKDGLRI